MLLNHDNLLQVNRYEPRESQTTVLQLIISASFARISDPFNQMVRIGITDVHSLAPYE